MLTPSQESAVEQAVASLNDFLTRAWIEVSSSTRFYNASSRAGALGALDSARKVIENLEGKWLDYVRTGTGPGSPWTFRKWADLAAEAHETIRYAIDSVEEWSLSGVLSSVADETYTEAKEVAADLGGGFGIGALVGVVLVVGLAIAWKLK